MPSIHTIEDYSAIKRNEMGRPGDVMLNKIYQSQKDKYSMNPLMWVT